MLKTFLNQQQNPTKAKDNERSESGKRGSGQASRLKLDLFVDQLPRFATHYFMTIIGPDAGTK